MKILTLTQKLKHDLVEVASQNLANVRIQVFIWNSKTLESQKKHIQRETDTDNSISGIFTRAVNK